MMPINEDEYQFLQDATGKTSGTFNDLYAAYLRGLGFVGTLTDMIARNGSKLTPNTGVGGGLWLLITGFWSDSACWRDNAEWKDAL